MIKISDALAEIVHQNKIFEFGLNNQLFNLTQLASFIQPMIEARTKKEVKTSALVVALSRLQKKKRKVAPKIQNFEIENISVQSGLCVMSFPKSTQIHECVNKAYNEVFAQNGYFTFSESTSEITIVFENKFCSTIEKFINAKDAKYKNSNISSIIIRFDEKYFEIIGLLHLLIQTTCLQGINLIEVSSTYTEFIFYVDKKDVKIAFETIFQAFAKK